MISPATPPPEPRSRPGSLVARLIREVTADVTPLRGYPDYRRLWAGLTVSQLGQQMTTVAVAVQVFALTRSNFAVGLVGLCSLVPLAGFGLYGGSLVDAFDRRRVGLVTAGGLWVLSLLLVVQAALDLRSVGVLYVIVAVQSACFAVNSPARSAIVPRLLPADLLPAANALWTLSLNLGFTVGPLIGGMLLGAGGFALVYGVDALTFAAAFYAMWRLPALPREATARRGGLGSVLEGLRYLGGRPNLRMTFLADMCAMVLAQPRALFPSVAGLWYGGGSRTVGLLASAPAIGGLAAALLSGWLGRIRRQGRVVLICVGVYGAAVAGFGLSRSLALGVLLLAVSGAADMVSAVFRTTILQAATPDELRGRLQGVFVVVVAGGPRLGDFTSGSVATVTTPTFAVVAGGCACIVAVSALAARWPRFATYDAADPTP